MSTASTTAATPPTPTPAAHRSIGAGLLGTGTAAAILAAAGAAAVAGVARSGDVSLVVDDEQIPVAAFAIMTVLWTFVGTAMAAAMARWARRPRTLFMRTTVILTVLSCVPSATADAGSATRITLCVTHLVAATIAIPMLGRRLRDA